MYRGGVAGLWKLSYPHLRGSDIILIYIYIYVYLVLFLLTTWFYFSCFLKLPHHFPLQLLCCFSFLVLTLSEGSFYFFIFILVLFAFSSCAFLLLFFFWIKLLWLHRWKTTVKKKRHSFFFGGGGAATPISTHSVTFNCRSLRITSCTIRKWECRPVLFQTPAFYLNVHACMCVCVCVAFHFFFEHNHFTLFIKVEERKKRCFIFAALVAFRTALFQRRGKEPAISTTKEEKKDKKNEQCKLHNFVFVNARLFSSSPHLLP